MNKLNYDIYLILDIYPNICIYYKYMIFIILNKILLNYPFIRYLNASRYYSGINNNDITKLNLKILYTSNNIKINNVNYMYKLFNIQLNIY
jgi:hypothetical protein